MLWVILGDYGDGKTTYLAMVPFSEEYANREVLGNFTLRHPRYRKINLLDLMDIKENTLVLLDEMQNWFNSHESFSLTNDFLTDFIHMCDKRNVDVFGTSHRFMSLDVDFRWGCHRLVKCERIGKTNKSRLEDVRDFRFTTFSTYSLKVIDKRVLRYEKAKEYFKIFETKERIVRHNQPDRDLRLIMIHDRRRGIGILEGIANEVKKKIGNKDLITHARLRVELGKMGYGKTYEEEIYVLIKD